MSIRLFKGNKEQESVAAEAVADEMTEAERCVSELIMLTARLAQVLAREADWLDEMKISRIAELQDEKMRLTNALESIKKQLNKEPELLDEISDDQREDLRQVVTLFDEIMNENYSRLNTARLVNQKIIEAISEVVCESAKNDLYDYKGTANAHGVESISLTLNQRV